MSTGAERPAEAIAWYGRLSAFVRGRPLRQPVVLDVGVAYGNRTRNLRNHNPLLCRLS